MIKIFLGVPPCLLRKCVGVAPRPFKNELGVVPQPFGIGLGVPPRPCGNELGATPVYVGIIEALRLGAFVGSKELHLGCSKLSRRYAEEALGGAALCLGCFRTTKGTAPKALWVCVFS